MAESKTIEGSATEQFGGEAVEGLPEGKRSVAAFRQQLDKREGDFVPLLPSNVSKERLKAVATEAVRQNPLLLQCDARSLFGAVAKAAKDGLVPDGREGVITPYKGKGGLVAQWNPMAHGLRKRARELEGIIVDCDVVFASDQFEFCGGDRPTLSHKRPPLGQDRGAIVGAYAIFRKGEAILHREVMDLNEIENTRAQSKQPDSLMWTRFKPEGYKKTVLRRGFKSVPCSEPLEEIVRREDEAFDFDQSAVVQLPAPKVVEHQVEPEAGEEKPKAARTGGKGKAKGKAPAKPKAASEAPAGSSEVEPEPKAKPAKKAKERVAPSVLAVRTKMFAAGTAEALQKVYAEQVMPFEWSEGDRAALQSTYDERMGYKS